MVTRVGHRANLVGPPVNDCAVETVFPGDIMGSYGDFTSVENVSVWDLPYPVGWTNATWYEQPAAYRINNGCFCEDCHSHYNGTFFAQNYPDAEVPCTNSIFSFDYWDHAVCPQFFPLVECCNVHCKSTGCGSSDLCTGYDSGLHKFCASTPGCQSSGVTGEWPLTTFAMSNGCSRISVVTDNSGPTGCLEDYPAMQVDLAGHDGGPTYVGPGGGFGSTSFNPEDEERSNTGWDVADGDCWTIDFWFKSVPDFEGYDITGTCRIRAHWGLYPFQFAPSINTGAVFNGDWQHFTYDAHIEFPNLSNSPCLNSVLSIQTSGVDQIDTDCVTDGYRVPFYRKRGRFLVKAVHVYPCQFSSGVWVKRPSGLTP